VEWTVSEREVQFDRLREVIGTFCVVCPQIGYVQGMTFIANLLLGNLSITRYPKTRNP
jgi:hypothetical protein